MLRLTAVLLALFALAGCESPLLKAPPPPLGERLDAQQLTPTLAGNSLVTGEEVVPPLVVYFEPGGELRGLRSNNYANAARPDAFKRPGMRLQGT